MCTPALSFSEKQNKKACGSYGSYNVESLAVVMAQRIKVLAAKPNDLNSILKTSLGLLAGTWHCVHCWGKKCYLCVLYIILLAQNKDITQ